MYTLEVIKHLWKAAPGAAPLERVAPPCGMQQIVPPSSNEDGEARGRTELIQAHPDGELPPICGILGELHPLWKMQVNCLFLLK